MARVYLETSFFSACVSERTSDKSIGWRASSLEWWNERRQAHELFISDEVVAELSAPAYLQSLRALEYLDGLHSFGRTDEVEIFARLLVEKKVMPGPANAGDAIHVAFAVVNRVDVILSWNVKHLANPNKRDHLALVCLAAGLPCPAIITPDML